MGTKTFLSYWKTIIDLHCGDWWYNFSPMYTQKAGENCLSPPFVNGIHLEGTFRYHEWTHWYRCTIFLELYGDTCSHVYIEFHENFSGDVFIYLDPRIGINPDFQTFQTFAQSANFLESLATKRRDLVGFCTFKTKSIWFWSSHFAFSNFIESYISLL